MSLTGFISYKRVGWTGQTPWNPTNLNIMDKGIKDNNDMIANLRNEVSALNSNLSAIIPDYTKATKIFECVDYDTTRKNYIAPSDGYLNYQVFKGAIMINYAGILRFGSIVDDDGYATGGLVPIKKGTTVNIAGVRNTGDSSAISEVWFIPI